MARPRKENAEYFSHDTNMRNHRKIIALRSKYWLPWYAIYCMILEHIGSCDYFISKRDEVEQEIIAWWFWVPVADLIDIVSFCGRLDLLQIEWNEMKCKSMNERLSQLIEKREREREREKPKDNKWKFVSVAETTQPVAEMPHSIVKYSKVNIISSELTNFIEKWNSLKQIENKKWLPSVRVINEDIKKIRDKRFIEYWVDNILKAVNNYCIDISKRKDDWSWYIDHRFTVLEFLKQSNWLPKFINL